MMKRKNLLQGVFLVLGLWLAGCSEDHNETTGFYPPRFADTTYEVRLNQQEAIGFVDGSGDYALKIENPDLLEVSVNTDLRQLFITSVQKGETILIITDRKAGGTVRLKIKVTDSYLGLVCRDSNIPDFPFGTDLFLVDNADKDFYLFDQEKGSIYPGTGPILRGHYKTFSENNIPYLVLSYRNEEEGLETYRYDLSESSAELYTIMNKYLHSGWSESTPAVRSVGPRVYYCIMSDVAGSYKAYWTVDLMNMPAGILE